MNTPLIEKALKVNNKDWEDIVKMIEQSEDITEKMELTEIMLCKYYEEEYFAGNL